MHAKRAPADRQATARELRINLWDEVKLLEEWAKMLDEDLPTARIDPALMRFRANELRTLLNRGSL